MHDNLQISGIDAAIVCVYFAVVFGIGVYFSRHQKTTQDYFLAGRRVPGVKRTPERGIVSGCLVLMDG